MEEQRCALEDARRSLAHLESAGAVDEGKVLLKRLGQGQSWGTILGGFVSPPGSLHSGGSALKVRQQGPWRGSPARVGRLLRDAGRYVRAWRSAGREVWHVVVEVTQGERSALIRVAAQVRSAGAVVAPYLTSVGCAMRKGQLLAFEELRGKGLRPRWKGGAGISCPCT